MSLGLAMAPRSFISLTTLEEDAWLPSTAGVDFVPLLFLLCGPMTLALLRLLLIG
jgi:hypothetical protein